MVWKRQLQKASEKIVKQSIKEIRKINSLIVIMPNNSRSHEESLNGNNLWAYI